MSAPWLQTFTGRAFHVAAPDPFEVDILDIAHALSQQNRYAGHTCRPYSVAQHCCHVSDALPKDLALVGLMHDAAEAYLVDIPSPIKPLLQGYDVLEDLAHRAICARFNISWTIPAEVKRVDRAILADEAAQLMAPPPKPWVLTEPALGLTIPEWTPLEAATEFLGRFHWLTFGAFIAETGGKNGHS